MLGVIGIIIISIAIFVLTYIKSEENRFTKAIVCSGLITVLCFVGPYIVDAMSNWGEGKTEEPGNLCEIEENKEEHMHKTASEEKENVIEATCLDSGQYEEVSYCECGEALERKIITIDALGHNYIKMITNPSCNERGFTTYKCSRCQDSYVDNYVEAIAHDFADGICLRCGLVTPEYETMILSRANELLYAGNYEDALNLVNNALEIKDSEALQQLCESIYAAQKEVADSIVYTAKTVNFVTYSGSIEGNDETDTYLLTIPLDGYYRFDLSGMINGFYVKLYVYDSEGNRVGGYSGAGNDNEIKVEMNAGEKYTIHLMQDSSVGSYEVGISK